MPTLIHIGVGSTSGWGKTTALSSFLYQFHRAGGVELALADSSGGLGLWSKSDLLRWPFCELPDDITRLFLAVGDELTRRQGLFAQAGNAQNLNEYNQGRGDLPPLLPLIVVTDECNSLLKGHKEAGDAAESLGYRGRKFGLWLLLAGQRWTGDSVPTGLKNQMSTRLALKMMSKQQSQNLIMSGDAADLNVIGRALCIIPGNNRVEVQVPFVSKEEIINILTGQSGPKADLPITDVEPVDDKAQQVIDAYKETGTISGAARVFGTPGGNNFTKAKDILTQAGLL
jgi:S-DNA-T family DNA segregation ATPase FtsK/SpoIIIE